MAPAVCLDPAKAQKNLIRTPNLLRNHEQRRASADKLCLGGYPASHTRLVQRIPCALRLSITAFSYACVVPGTCVCEDGLTPRQANSRPQTSLPGFPIQWTHHLARRPGRLLSRVHSGLAVHLAVHEIHLIASRQFLLYLGGMCHRRALALLHLLSNLRTVVHHHLHVHPGHPVLLLGRDARRECTCQGDCGSAYHSFQVVQVRHQFTFLPCCDSTCGP